MASLHASNLRPEQVKANASNSSGNTGHWTHAPAVPVTAACEGPRARDWSGDHRPSGLCARGASSWRDQSAKEVRVSATGKATMDHQASRSASETGGPRVRTYV